MNLKTNTIESSVMHGKIRSLSLLFYRYEADLIVALENLEKKIGKYDFFTNSIDSIDSNLLQSGFLNGIKDDKIATHMRALSFENVKKFSQFERYCNKTRQIINDLAEENHDLSIINGFVQENQIILAFEQPQPTSIEFKKLHYKVEFFFKQNKIKSYDQTSLFLLSSDLQIFLSDLRRLV